MLSSTPMVVPSSETGEYYAEADGSVIANAIGAVSWNADRVQ
ncbi:hypothetical protein B0G84_7651 [Paraburkholderia sp. BL8N3]|nr:hypothetical protein [Paraburkholderia sp. BL8N3]TCK33431.1 hypothetical protein B0G84_7651 [Paraburkholderia sp. BL8N3]